MDVNGLPFSLVLATVFFLKCIATSYNVKYLCELNNIPEPPSQISTCWQRVSHVSVSAGFWMQWFPSSVKSAHESADGAWATSVLLIREYLWLFHYLMIMIKLRHFRLISYWHSYKLMGHCSKEALVNCYHISFSLSRAITTLIAFAH